MQQVLQFFSKNAFLGVIAGAFVTAVIQSSAATTIMVLGFINAGLLNLVQAIGIIFGANIGTVDVESAVFWYGEKQTIQ